jgi:hypothetical protein
MKLEIATCRKAYTLAEFAQIFGRHRSWAYRQAREGRIKTITGYGAEMVPVHEVDRILGKPSEGMPSQPVTEAALRKGAL